MQMIKGLGPKLMFIYTRKIKNNRICTGVRLSLPWILSCHFRYCVQFAEQFSNSDIASTWTLPEVMWDSTQLPTQRRLVPFWMPWVMWELAQGLQMWHGACGSPSGGVGEGQPALPGASTVGMPLWSHALAIKGAFVATRGYSLQTF